MLFCIQTIIMVNYIEVAKYEADGVMHSHWIDYLIFSVDQSTQVECNKHCFHSAVYSTFAQTNANKFSTCSSPASGLGLYATLSTYTRKKISFRGNIPLQSTTSFSVDCQFQDEEVPVWLSLTMLHANMQ